MTVHKQLCTPIGVQEVAKEWWDCEVPPELAETLSAEYVKKRKKGMEQDFADGKAHSAIGQLIWLKSRLNDAELLPVSGKPPPDDKPTAVTAILHVGFVTLPETEEMLARLQNEEPREDTNKPARSKMFEIAQKQNVAPIDALAGIVAHTSQQDKQ